MIAIAIFTLCFIFLMELVYLMIRDKILYKFNSEAHKVTMRLAKDREDKIISDARMEVILEYSKRISESRQEYESKIEELESQIKALA